jgi:hypothetical protein
VSAFILDRAHILALTRTAIDGPSDPREIGPGNVWHGVNWTTLPVRELEHWSEVAVGRTDWQTAEDLARLLYDENVASVRYRYADADESGMVPTEVAFTMSDIRRARRLTAADALCALASFEYQACEHPEWSDGEAARFCDAFRRSLCHVISRGSDCWSIRDEVSA